MLGSPIAKNAVAGPTGAATTTSPPVVVTPPPAGTIDATKVPTARRIVFDSSIRVVKFPGSVRKVIF